MKISEIVKKIEDLYPVQSALPNDFAGLLCGEPSTNVSKILIALSMSEAVVNEAVSEHYNFLIIHIPPFTNIPSGFVPNSPDHRIIFRAIKNSLPVYVISSNLEFGRESISRILAKKLGMEIEGSIIQETHEKVYKIAVFIPYDSFEKFRTAILSLGVGKIGKYSHASFSASGEGTFMPLQGSDPYIGDVGKLEKVKEYRFEVIVPEHILQETIEAIRLYHPYEEPAFDIYRLENSCIGDGYGVIGELPYPLSINDLALKCIEKLPSGLVKIVPTPKTFIQKIAIWTGNGDIFVDRVCELYPDAYLVGELGYRSALKLSDLGIGVIAMGIFASKWSVLPCIKDLVMGFFSQAKEHGLVEISQSDKSPFLRI